MQEKQHNIITRLIIMVSVFTVSCATVPKPSVPPDWWLNPPRDAVYYYGTGSAVVAGEEWGAWEAAREAGLKDIAYKVETRISAMQIDYNLQTNNQELNFFTSISAQITDVILYDTRPIKRERRRGPEGESCYVLLAAPKDKARTVISEFIEQEVQKNPLFQRETAEKVMEAELKKMDTPNSTPAPITQSSSLVKKRADYAKRNSLGTNLSLEWSDGEVGMGVEVLEFHWSFLPFTSGGIGLYPCLIGGYDTLESEGIFLGGSLYAGLVYPLTINDGGFNTRFYTDFVFNINSGRYMTGLGFDAGLAITASGVGLDLRYRGVVYEGHYVNSLGIGFVTMFDDL
ncbi:MAG: LPP20 family lipoprotein [Treponema sp.]|nr:LPP20 family lipoprotein [Treponema sp.]